MVHCLCVSPADKASNCLYDRNGIRPKKTVGSNNTYYIGEYYEVDKQGTTTTQTRKYIFAGDTRVAVINKIGSTKTYFYFHMA